MKRLTDEQKKANLTEYLRLVSNNTELFIYSSGKGADIVFAVAYYMNGHAVNTITAFRGYKEMEHFFKGALAITQGTIKLN
jgi:hypothetical protein